MEVSVDPGTVNLLINSILLGLATIITVILVPALRGWAAKNKAEIATTDTAATSQITDMLKVFLSTMAREQYLALLRELAAYTRIAQEEKRYLNTDIKPVLQKRIEAFATGLGRTAMAHFAAMGISLTGVGSEALANFVGLAMAEASVFKGQDDVEALLDPAKQSYLLQIP